MNYIPCVAWGMCPGGTDKQIANYGVSWGLFGNAPAPGTATSFGTWMNLCLTMFP